MQDVTVIFRRRGGDDLEQSHTQWEKTVKYSPDVICMQFVPITSLLDGIPGKEHLTRAIALYLECKTSYLSFDILFFVEYEMGSYIILRYILKKDGKYIFQTLLHLFGNCYNQLLDPNSRIYSNIFLLLPPIYFQRLAHLILVFCVVIINNFWMVFVLKDLCFLECLLILSSYVLFAASMVSY